MAEYHVGCGAFGIYAGTLNKKKTMWQNKSEVTQEAIDSVAEWFLQTGEHVTFGYKGKKYKMCVIPIEEEVKDG